MIILGIETSCDETSVGIVEKKGDQLVLKSNIVATSLQIHSQNGGIIPELAAREQVKYMIPVLEQALSQIPNSKFQIPKIDAIAVTFGPGLIGSLLVGIETAKTLSILWNKPLVPVNHMLGHVYANWLFQQPQTSILKPQFPALILVVSGGHTDLLLMKAHGDYEVIGGTRDDAAGEAFDKIARLIGLPYPGGPAIQKAAEKGNPKAIHFPRPLIGEKSYDFSFSGLKTAVYRHVSTIKEFNNLTICDLAASAQAAIIDVLVKKTIRAAEKYDVKSILLSGGVASNDLLRNQFSVYCSLSNVMLFAPQKAFCTDNGAMVAAAAAFNYHPIPWQEVTVNPQLYY
ncbi:MAG TPA: tRNA (adenosine(37)-N6)-threonylcarbamoyltransferase complex transferase subunit TsaD [Patescibacteria group bacterium]|nr:tRNA (adenosine(37)-N6)-threonylcarbamoyltransferase complex transferase subunit TsaD [Patescibacteria group bacterium]